MGVYAESDDVVRREYENYVEHSILQVICISEIFREKEERFGGL